MLDHAAEFRHRVRISRVLLPARRRRSKLPRKLHPRTIALSYYRAIAPILERARKMLERTLTPLLPQLAQQSAEAQRHDGARADAVDLNEVIDAVGKEFFDSLKPAEISALAEKFARATSDFEKEQAVKQVRSAFGVDVMMREPQLAAKERAFVTENVALIKSIPSQFFDDVEKRIARAVASGATPKQLAAELADRYKVADDRAMLIARDQTGKYYGQVAEARQKSMGVTRYIWRTSNDERVREEHAAREGESFSWDDPPEGGHPGEDFQCRCYAEPDLSALLGDDEPAAQESEPQADEPATDTPAPAPEELTIAPEPPEQDDRDRALAAEAALAAAREEHAAELERRLAEQERVRAERERAIEEAHAAAIRTVEERNRALEAESARLRAATPAPDALQREHLENASGVSARTANQREAELTRLKSEPINLQRFAGLEQGNVAGVREEIDKIIAQTTGARLSTSDLARKEIVLSGEPAVQHGHDGTIKVSKEIGEAAGRFAASVASGETAEQLARRQAAYESRLATLTQADDRLSSVVRSARGAKKAEAIAERERIRAELGPLRRTIPPKDEAQVMQSMVHEAMHGHSPVTGSTTYRGVGIVTEEATTELAARVAMGRAFPGVSVAGPSEGSYAHYIEPLTSGVAQATGQSAAQAYEIIKQAAVDVKSNHVDLASTPTELRDKYARAIAARAGVDPAVVAAMLDSLA